VTPTNKKRDQVLVLKPRAILGPSLTRARTESLHPAGTHEGPSRKFVNVSTCSTVCSRAWRSSPSDGVPSADAPSASQSLRLLCMCMHSKSKHMRGGSTIAPEYRRLPCTEWYLIECTTCVSHFRHPVCCRVLSNRPSYSARWER
jgi:hypothetical protein